MATALESGLIAGSNLVTGTGTNVATFTLPSTPRYVVQSVVATVDNSAGGDTTATLTFADTNGAVIAKKRQGETLDSGITGTATFALRLTDEKAMPRGVRLGFEQLDETIANDLRVFSVFPPLGTSAIAAVEASALYATCTFGGANRRFVLDVDNRGTQRAVFHVASLYVQRLDVLAFERLDGANVSVGGGGGTLLPVSNHRGGAALLDLTTPTQPLVINAGTYAFTVWVQWG